MKRLQILLVGLMILIFSCRDGLSEKTEKHVNIESLDGRKIGIEKFEAFITNQIDSLKIKGLSIAIINKGKVVLHIKRGYSNSKDNLRVDDKTIFEGASISKSIFAYFVMKVVEEGKINLDEPLFKYLQHPDIDYDRRYKKITARMVLAHKTGFPNWREHNKDGLLDLKFEPNTDFAYSGEGYQYLANVIAKIYHTDLIGLEDVFHKKVTEPLNMTNTFFIENEYTKKHKAEPYIDELWFDWKNNYWHIKNKGHFVAPSSILTESVDFSKFIIALMNKTGLNAVSFDELFEPQITLPEENILRKKFGISQWSLGFHIVETKDGVLYGHGGNNEGFQSLFNFSIERKWGFVFFTNCDKGNEFGKKMEEFFLKKD